jgi:hypothetical protein
MEVHVIGRVCHPCKHTEGRDRACSEIFEELGRRTDDTGKRSSHIVDRMQNVGWCADRVKILLWDTSGLVLIWKQLQQDSFRWPPIMNGVMKLSPVEFAALFDGLDWTRVQTVKGIHKPTVAA